MTSLKNGGIALLPSCACDQLRFVLWLGFPDSGVKVCDTSLATDFNSTLELLLYYTSTLHPILLSISLSVP